MRLLMTCRFMRSISPESDFERWASWRDRGPSDNGLSAIVEEELGLSLSIVINPYPPYAALWSSRV
jgi:hypothetical protein